MSWIRTLLLPLALCLALPGTAGSRRIQTHDELTEAWNTPGDYEVAFSPALTCTICTGEREPGFTTEGCQRHFSHEPSGICKTCLSSMDLGTFLKEGIYHDHRLPDGTEHRCLVTAGGLLEFFQGRGLAESIQELRDLQARQPQLYRRWFEDAKEFAKLKSELKQCRAWAANARTRSQQRNARHALRTKETEYRRVVRLRPLAGIHDWAETLAERYGAMANSRQELDQLRALCHTCGKYSREHAGLARDAAAADACKSFFWNMACPACGLIGGMPNTDNCSVVPCVNCLRSSGEGTKTCVVCRRTTRGTRVLFEGKPGFDHDHCVELMRRHVDDPGALGHFDVCQCEE
ncbi:MAG: hypothetical protein ABSH53_06320 [Holophaga sp.]|jgi:hypothetical protein